MKSGNILIYDADCRLCVTSKQWLEKWDPQRQIEFVPFQDSRAKDLVPELTVFTRMDAIRFVDPEGRVFTGVAAFRRMLPLLPGGWVLSSLFYLPGFLWMAHILYRHLAAHRYRMFGPVRRDP